MGDNFDYNGTKITVLKEARFEQSLEACNRIQSSLIDLRNVNISKFSNVFNSFAGKFSNRYYRVKSSIVNLTENNCFGLIKFKLETQNVNKIVYEICSNNDYFNNTFPSICQSSINENELTKAIINIIKSCPINAK